MMTTNSAAELDPTKSVVLKPAHRLPLLVTGIGFIWLTLPGNLWAPIALISFGFFLLIQSFILKLEFTPDDLVVWQLGRELRRFPFKSWLAWRLLLPKLPGILYFREEASPHLLPILFDPVTLENQLKLRVGNLETPKQEFD